MTRGTTLVHHLLSTVIDDLQNLFRFLAITGFPAIITFDFLIAAPRLVPSP